MTLNGKGKKAETIATLVAVAIALGTPMAMNYSYIRDAETEIGVLEQSLKDHLKATAKDSENIADIRERLARMEALLENNLED